MRPTRGPKIVLLGMMSKMPVGGVVWQTLHYLLGLRLLGYDAYYIEAHARTPGMLMAEGDGDGSRAAADFIGSVLGRYDLADRWAFHALHADGRCYGMSEGEVSKLYRSADLLINLHGGTEPLPEHAETGRLVYVETDPVQLQVELLEGRKETIDFLSPHCAFFTFAENYGSPDCKLPQSSLFPFHTTRQPVVMDLWREMPEGGSEFTTIGNWKQPWRDVNLGGEVYRWSKHVEFEKVLDLPTLTGQSFELALSGYAEADCRLLEKRGWKVLPALGFSRDPDAYRGYIQASRAEFTVAKDQNVRLRTGWFSDRSATYLAAGRPVVTQETGFSNILPTGDGLFSFTTVQEAAEAVGAINGDYEHHRRVAARIAREHFSHDVVLPPILELVGLSQHRQRSILSTGGFPPDLVLTPVSRWPTRLPDRTARFALAVASGGADPRPALASSGGAPVASIVVVTHNGLPFTVLCLESLLANTEGPEYEVVVVDNGSVDGTGSYLRGLADRDSRIRVLCNRENLGFASANNRGLASTTGRTLVLLNNDTIVPPGWLSGLIRHLEDPAIGLVGPVTNRAGNEAEVDVPYRTYAEFLAFARKRSVAHTGEVLDLRTAIMFCLAFPRDVHRQVGPLDERFEIAMFEDDDYSLRAQKAGYRVVCAEDVLVHHFGQATIGNLAATQEYGQLFHANCHRFEEKWGVTWEPHLLRPRSGYSALRSRVREAVERSVPSGATVLVVTKGDDELLDMGGRRAEHFPQGEDGGYSGYHPADSLAAITHLERRRGEGARYLLFPETAMWWLDHYVGLRDYLYDRYVVAVRSPGTCLIFDISSPVPEAASHTVRLHTSTRQNLDRAGVSSDIVGAYAGSASQPSGSSPPAREG
jgi:GT2 family glycosyltransferase